MNTPKISKFLKLYWFLPLFLCCAGVPAHGEVKRVTKEIVIAETLWPEMAVKVVKQIQDADKDGNILILKFSSRGGTWEAGSLISQAILATKTPVICVNVGNSASMTMVPFAVCPVRVMVKGTTLMFHEPYLAFFAEQPQVTRVKMDQLRSELEGLERLNNMMAKLITLRWKMSAEEYKKKISGIDWEVTAEEAVQLKAADFVISSYDEVFTFAKTL